MKKLIKIISLVLTLLVVVALGLVVYILTLDPNQFRDDISGLMAEQGVDLTIDGDLSWKLYPELMLSMHEVSVATPGIEGSLQELQLQLKLWPLLQQRIEFIGLRLVQPQVVFDPAAMEQAAQAAPAASTSGEPAVLPSFSFETIRVTEGYLAVLGDDAEPLVLTNIRLDADGLNTLGNSFTASGGFTLEPGEAELLTEPLNFELEAQLDSGTARLDISSLTTRVGLDGTSLPISFTGKLAYGISENSFNLSEGDLRADELNLQLTAVGTSEPVNLGGTIRSSRFNLADLLTKMGVETGIADGLEQAEFAFDYQLEGQTARLTNLRALVDDSNLQGSGEVRFTETLAVSLRGQLDSIDLDRYFPPAADASAAAGAASQEAPLPTLPAHSADISFDVGALRLAGLDFSNIALRFTSNANRIDLTQFSGSLAGGLFNMTGRAGLGSAAAEHQVRLEANGVAIGEILRVFTGSPAATGNLSATYAGTARGDRLSAVVGSLTGQGEVSANSLILDGIDVEGTICDVSDRIQRQSLASTYGELGTSTPLSDIRANIRTADGHASFDGLVAAIGNIQAGGTGRLNMVTNDLRMDLRARIAGDKTSETGCTVNRYLVNRNLPLVCSGNLTAGNISCAPDGDFVAEALRGALQQGVMDQIQQRLLPPGEEGEEGAEQEPLRQLLEGLFRRN